MMKLKVWIVLMALCLLLSACGNTVVSSQQEISASEDSVSSAAVQPGELIETYVPEYAKGFSIEYYEGGAKIIDIDHAVRFPAAIKAAEGRCILNGNIDPVQDVSASTAAAAQRILLLPAGATEPLDAQWDGKIEGEVTSVVTLASSHAGHFANLDAVDVVKGCSIKPESCYVNSLKTALENGSAVYVGTSSSLDQELIASLAPQVIFVGGMSSDVEVAQKLEESGLLCVYFGDFAEEDYMGRAQWIELIGAFVNKDQQARDFIRENKAQVDEVLAKVQSAEEHPSVLWYTHSSSAPHFNVRTDADYVNSIVSAAGGRLLFPQSAQDNSIKLSNEDFLLLMNEADKIVMGVSLNSYRDAKDMTYFNKEGQVDFSKAPAFANRDCYVVGYDWAQDTANAAEIIRSMAACLYPDLFADEKAEDKDKIIAFWVE